MGSSASLRVQEGQEIAIQFAPRSIGDLIADAVNAEALARPLAAIPIAFDAVHAICLQQSHKFLDGVLRGERRLPLSDGIQNDDLAFCMRDGESERVG